MDSKSAGTADVKIASCLAQLPAGGGTVDAQVLQGPQTWATDPFTKIRKQPVALDLGPGVTTITASVVFPANLTVKCANGSVLSIAAGFSLTINGSMDCAPIQIFSGPGRVTLGPGAKVPVVYPQWWGASGSGMVDDADAIQSALDALPSGGGTIYFSAGIYNVSHEIVPPSGAVMRGASMYSSKLRNTNMTGERLIHGPNSTDGNAVGYYLTFEDLWFQGNELSGDGLYLYAPYGVFLNRVRVTDHGGIGVHFKKGTGSLLYMQSMYLENSFVSQNRKGGIKFDGGGDIAGIHNCAINQNAYYGVYADRQVLLEIGNSEFAGYYFGGVIPGHQAIPIVINGGNNILVENTSFENNGGNAGAKASYNIRTGYDGDNQSDSTNTTEVLIVRNNDFKMTSGTGGDLRDIRLNYVQRVIIEGNLFEKAAGYKGNGYAVEYAALLHPALQYRGNKYGSLLNGKEYNAYSGYYLNMDENPGTEGLDGFGAQTDSADRTPFRVRFAGDSNDRYEVDGLGRVKIGDGATPPVQVLGSRAKGWSDQTAAPSRSDLGANPSNAQIAAFLSALYADLKAHGLLGN